AIGNRPGGGCRPVQQEDDVSGACRFFCLQESPMTYCVALNLAEGLVFVSDSRTNAGVDHIATFRKLHVFGVPGERLIVLQSAGNLATSQSVVALLRQRLDHEVANLYSVPTLFDPARLVGERSEERRVGKEGRARWAPDQ